MVPRANPLGSLPDKQPFYPQMTDLLHESDWPVVVHFLQNGPAPIIGTFEPVRGDMGRDGNWPLAQIRMFDDRSGWIPSFESVPRQTHAKNDQ